ncbi:MAG: thioredoxin-dependent thiol peroxidase [Chitinophagaceae bacterium]|nr:thioredoxin-dependent thiol peroxidase [Chitinophagaceae bacterium]
MAIQAGDKAPAFTLKNQDGKKVSLKDFKGQKVLLYFYPEDDTPLCTEEACHLKEHIHLFQLKNIVILGVSPDDVKRHGAFIEKFQLPFSLLSDPDHSMMETYGVWVEKTMFGHKHMGVKRSSFLINEDGYIDHVIKQVISKKQIEQIRKIWKDL